MRNPLKLINWKAVFQAFLWVIALGGLGFLMSFIAVKSNDYACNDLQVIIPGEQSFVVREDVDKVLKETQGAVIGKTLSAIPIHEIEQDLRAIPFIEKAIVTKDMSGKIIINIKQREAVLRVINQQGHDYYVDTHGLKIPLSPHYAPHVLVANGFIKEGFKESLDSVQSPLLGELFKIAQYIEKDTLWASHIEQLFVDAKDRIEMVPRVGNQKIIIGDADFLEEKFNKLNLFYTTIIPTVGWEMYKTVDLSFSNQLVCEKNEHIKKENIIQ